MSKLNIMRLNSPDMVFGLVDFCNDAREYLGICCDLVEVGSYAGESTQIFWEHLMPYTIHCVDKWDITNKYNKEEIEYAEKIFHVLHNEKIDEGLIGVYKRHSRDEKLKELIKNPDIVYIDASHDYADVSKDIDFWMQFNPRIISGHDYSQKFKGVMQAVNERFKPEEIKTYRDTSWAIYLK
jgi:hypothetical protein